MTKEINGRPITRDQAVEQNLKLVYQICHKFKVRGSRLGLEFDDLAQIGAIGLMKAYENYDSSLGFQFSTYASPRIAGEIRRAIHETNLGAKYPPYLKFIAGNITKDMVDLPVEEIAAKLDVSESQVIEALKYKKNCFPVYLEKETKNCGEPSDTIHYFIGRNDDTSSAYVQEFINSLRAPLQTVLKGRLECKKQVEIAQELGCSQVQVSRMVKEIRGLYAAYEKGNRINLIGQVRELELSIAKTTVGYGGI
ncbi:sigma-70 family RNA polymerase sigma factor [Bacillus sp. SCS-151]|uniref:sigma-70 family RNA polymerase sigma factor n=1 Tax=Nanhaiella sioensis TaxID=3115293 RepID=UPI00397948CC